MENKDEIPDETSQGHSELNAEGQPALLLSDVLMDRARQIGRAGKIVMILFLTLCGLYTVNLLIDFWEWQTTRSGDFYLLEGNNAYQVWRFCSTAIMVYLFVRGAWAGFQAMRNIYTGSRYDDDDALLNGFEGIKPMLKWFTIWGAFWLLSDLLEKIYLWNSLN
ncbi:MAG: hypothetical protein L6Q97_04920 [Thermoanaerobaculia bacterium]|nr:hypothetical protein [Thermoanaerobaculia bacterium]